MRCLPVVIALGLGGCNSKIKAGDYVVFRVAFEAAEQDAGCYLDGVVPPNLAEDSSTYLGASVFILYFGAEEEVFLDTGIDLLPGTQNKKSFQFAAESTDVEELGGTTTTYYGTYTGYTPPTDTGLSLTLTTVHSVSINFVQDKGGISGTWESDDQVTCSGDCGAMTPIDCNTSIKFVGAQLEDVELPHRPSEDF